ncbi:MAG: DUF6949 family protein [Hyphomicrobiales bacterium]
METQYFAYLFAIAVGLVSAGIMGSIWTLFAGKELRAALPRKAGVDATLEMLAIGVNAPLAMVRTGSWYLSHDPILALIIIALGLGWSFLQGVFILTLLFGFR